MTTSARRKRGGFTLIELLIVLAIIGILAYYILPSLFSARQKGTDAGVEAGLHTVKTQAELFYTNSGENYGAAGNGCSTASSLFSDPTIADAIAQITQDSNSATVACNNTPEAFAVQALLTSPSVTTYECIDSTGNTSTSSTALGTDIVCPL